MTKRRIWEIDAFRGFCMLLVFVAHFCFDLRTFFHVSAELGVLELLFQYGGLVFVVLSGISATLGSRSFRRGVNVFGCGMAITAITYGMIFLELIDPRMKIQFGILHLLGVCMMAYPLLKKLPTWALAVAGTVIVALGYWFMTFRLHSTPGFDWRSGLFVLGIMLDSFSAGDFFPICPYLGWFMLGIVLGRTVYGKKISLFPSANERTPAIRFLTFCGRHSLVLYLIHQPILYAVFWLVSQIL